MYVFNINDNIENVYFFIIQLKIVITITQVAFAFSDIASVWKKVCGRSIRRRKKNL